jgi:hypothetical protein
MKVVSTVHASKLIPCSCLAQFLTVWKLLRKLSNHYGPIFSLIYRQYSCDLPSVSRCNGSGISFTISMDLHFLLPDHGHMLFPLTCPVLHFFSTYLVWKREMTSTWKRIIINLINVINTKIVFPFVFISLTKWCKQTKKNNFLKNIKSVL